MASPCVITYNGKDYTLDEFMKSVSQGEIAVGKEEENVVEKQLIDEVEGQIKQLKNDFFNEKITTSEYNKKLYPLEDKLAALKKGTTKEAPPKEEPATLEPAAGATTPMPAGTQTQEVTNPVEIASNDKENIQGLPSEERIGQEPVAAQPEQAGGRETPQASGVLQAQEQEEVDTDKHPKYNEALKVVQSTGHASVPLIQRRLNTTYTQAQEIFRQLERDGHVLKSDENSNVYDVVTPEIVEEQQPSSDALKDVESTAKALEGVAMDSPQKIIEAAKSIDKIEYVEEQEARDIIESYTHYKSGNQKSPATRWAGWFQSVNAANKKFIVDDIQNDPKLRNAMLSLFYDVYKAEFNFNGTFDDFLNAEITLYRGITLADKKGVGQEGFSAFSTTKNRVMPYADEQALGKGKIREIKIKPKDTYGAVNYIGGGEVEVLVPTDFKKETLKDDFNRLVELNIGLFNEEQLNYIEKLYDKEDYISGIAFAKSVISSNPKKISEAYYKAKKDGSNPELVKAVEELIGGQQQQSSPQPVKDGTTPEQAKKRLDDDLEIFKSIKDKKTAEQKFIGTIERAWLAKEQGKITKPEYTEFKKKAQQVLEGKIRAQDEAKATEAKLAVSKAMAKVKDRLVGKGHSPMALSAPIPVTPRTVADLIDLATSLANKAIDAGMEIKLAFAKAKRVVATHPTYMKLAKSGLLNEANFMAELDKAEYEVLKSLEELKNGSLINVMKDVFGLPEKEAQAASIVAESMINTMAKRSGVSSQEMLRKINFKKESLENLPTGVKMQVSAWHGSPHAFDKFTTEKIGTGEGAQAFGWGLYFTDLESIARNYADKLSEFSMKVNGIELDTKKDSKNPLFRVQLSVWGAKNKNEAISKIEEDLSLGRLDRVDAQNALDYLIDEVETFETTKDRNLYKVSLHKGKSPSEYTWLEWDKLVSADNIIKINKALEQRGIPATPKKYMEVGFDGRVSAGMKGRDVYSELVKIFGDEYKVEWGKQASLFLLENGIDGIKYPAESISRGATSDTARGFNYVVFDENAVSIEEVIKFQKEAEKAMGAAMVTMDGMATIYALTDPNVSTPLHELAHVYEHYLTPEEKNEILKSAGTKDWNIETSEYFARGFEKYLSEGNAPTQSLKAVFESFKKWLLDIYNNIVGSEIDINLNKEMRAIYDSMLTGKVYKKSIEQPSEISGPWKPKKTGERLKASPKMKEVIKEMTDDDMMYLSIDMDKASEYVNNVLNQFQAEDKLTELAEEILAGNSPFPEKIKNVANARLADRLRVMSENINDTFQKRTLIQKAGKLWSERMKSINISATQVALERLVAKDLPLSTEGIKEMYQSAFQNTQEMAMGKENVDAVKDAYNSVQEALQTEEGAKTLREAVMSELERVAEALAGKEWLDKFNAARKKIKKDLSDC